MDNQKRREKRPQPKPSKRSRPEIRRRNIQQGKRMEEGVQQVQQVEAKVPVSKVKELAAVQGSMGKKDKKLLGSSGIMQVGAYLQEDTLPGPAPSESSELGEQKQSPVAPVDAYKKDLPAYRPKYTPQEIKRKKALFLEAMERGIFTPGVAADAAGISRNTAFAWRDKDAEFGAAWDQAIEKCLDQIEERMRQIGLELNQPHKVTAAMFLLNGYRRERFMPMSRMEHTGPGGGPILMGVMAKIRKMSTEELRAELGKLLGSALVQPGEESEGNTTQGDGG